MHFFKANNACTIKIIMHFNLKMVKYSWIYLFVIINLFDRESEKMQMYFNLKLQRKSAIKIIIVIYHERADAIYKKNGPMNSAIY